MQSIVRQLHAVLAWVLVVALVVQVWLAGRGVFESPEVFVTHRDVGYVVSLLPILLLVVGLVARMGRRVAILAVVIFGLFILQSVFVAVRGSLPGIAALHPVNGFVILFLAIWLARESWAMRAATA